MKISERIALIKAGYTKDEINSMITEDAKVSEDPKEPEAANNDNDYMKVLSVLANEVKDLKEAMYSSNINNSNIDKGSNVIKAEDILSSLINPKEENK